MAKIVYLLGAGASKNALPLVAEIPSRLEQLLERLKSPELCLDEKIFPENLGISVPKSKRQYQLEMMSALQWLLDESRLNASVDTLAKKLFLTEDGPTLKKLKIALSIFFVCEQAFNRPDVRYDSFLASILQSVSRLPENIRILSWNYDYQFEMSCSAYTKDRNILVNQNRLQVNTKFATNDGDPGFNIYKLNGAASLYYYRGQFHYVNSYGVAINKEFIGDIVRGYVMGMYSSGVESLFLFSWEEENSRRSTLDVAIASAKDAAAVVVIGYSFPFFNRGVDRKIFSGMTNLKRVYFQSPEAEEIRERFEAIRDNLEGIELVPKKDVSQFLLPNEL